MTEARRAPREAANGAAEAAPVQSAAPPTPWERLREPFPPERIHVLPKPTRRENAKGTCEECGGWHGLPAVHLDYVGHADVTDRLLAVDPQWNWEPLAFDSDGLPRMIHAEDGSPIGLWIRLTVCAASRLGYGSVEPGAFEPEKQLIGDALRNAAMRFGVGLDLWRKDESKRSQIEGGPTAPAASTPALDPKDDMGPCDEPGCAGRLAAKAVKTRAGREMRVVECTNRRFGRRGSCDRETDWRPDWAHYAAYKQRHETGDEPDTADATPIPFEGPHDTAQEGAANGPSAVSLWAALTALPASVRAGILQGAGFRGGAQSPEHWLTLLPPERRSELRVAIEGISAAQAETAS